MEFREDERRRRDPFWKVIAGCLALALVASFVLLVRSTV
jgi:hypothetical protein